LIGTNRIWLLYAVTATVFAAIGYWFSVPSPYISSIYFAREPESPPDFEVSISSLEHTHPAIESTVNVAWVRERELDDSVKVRYWCPKTANEWGEVVVHWQWEHAWSPKLALLELNIQIFSMFDPFSEAQVFLSSQDTGGRWKELVRFDVNSSDKELSKAIDVSPWVSTSRYLRIKYRMKGQKWMYHPTPNDPIGIAGAQCLRQGNGQTYSSRLRLWKQDAP
jgi:hypothetical protein